MDVELEILQGRLKQGKAAAGVNRFAVRLRRFVIGSDASCHMVCKSRTISGRHCLIVIEQNRVLVRDLESAAGTFINDVPVEGSQVICHGDKLRIGRLEFVLHVTGNPQPPPQVGPAATPNGPPEQSIETVVGSETVDALVTDILQQEDDAAREARLADPAARYFRRDEVASNTEPPAEPAAEQPKQRPAKKQVGKLPPPPSIKANDSVSAADLALRELFQPKGPGRS